MTLPHSVSLGLDIYIYTYLYQIDRWASQVALVVKYPPANAGDIKDVGLTPGSGRSPGREHGNSLQYSCLENPMDRGVWQVTVYRVAESDMTEATQDAC